MLREHGVPMLVLSKEANNTVAARCAKLKLPYVQGVDDKRAYLEKYLAEQRIKPASVAYLGNDVNDLGCLNLVGFPVVVRDAHPDVRGAARLVLTRDGGDGAVREFCDLAIAHLSKGARPHAEGR
jgi:N-acylneuraminate cytidylyltransferase